MNEKEAVKFLSPKIKPIKLGNKNKTGKCGMCGKSVKNLYASKVGQVDFMICENCKSIMNM